MDKIIKKLIGETDGLKFCCGIKPLEEELKYGDFILSGPCMGRDQPLLGYVVQIRKGWGAFGSENSFIRLHDEQLVTSENQGYWLLNKEQIAVVSPHFKCLPEQELDENADKTYSIAGKHEKSGFIIESDDAPGRVDHYSIAIAITKG